MSRLKQEYESATLGQQGAVATAPSLKTRLDAAFADHGALRLVFRNAHWVSVELVRSNQPWPHQLAGWKRRGIRTVVNLRGASDGSAYALERRACERLGLALVDFRISSKTPPTAAQVEGARRLFETIAYPALMHCKSGIDRTGVMSALYLHFRHGLSIAEAAGQLSVKYLHLRTGKAGVLHYTFSRYLAEAEPAGLSFAEWVASPGYRPDEILADYRRAAKRGGRLLDQVWRRE